MGEYELWVRFMCKYELWVNTNYGEDRQTDKQTDGHINTMTRPGLRAGRSENPLNCNKRLIVRGSPLILPPFFFLYYRIMTFWSAHQYITPTILNSPPDPVH